MIPSVEEGKALLLKEHAKEIGHKHPGWSFSQCWGAALASHPELREEFAGDTEQGTAVSARPSKIDMSSILEKYWAKPGPLKVQARKPPRVNEPEKNDQEVLLVMAADGSVVDLELW